MTAPQHFTERKEVLRLLWGVAILVGVGIAAYAVVGYLADRRRDELTRLLRIDDELTELLSALQDAETGQRGYLLTVDEAYLRPYREGLASTPPRLARVEALLGGRTSETDVAVLRGLSERKFAELAETIRLQRAGRRDEALALVRTDLGQALMDSLRAEIAASAGHRAATFEATSAQLRRLDFLRAGLLVAAALVLGGIVYAIYARVAPLLAQVDRSREALLRKNEELEHFAYIASHDLNEPLRTVTSFTELLVAEVDDGGDGEARDYARFITAATARMRTMIDGLLDYSRIGRSGAVTDVDLDALVAGIADDLSERLGATGGRLEVAPLPTVRARETELRQVFQNLIANALKFARAGIPPEVRVTATEEPTQWRLAVADNGIGIAPDQQAGVFRMFTKLHRREQYPGHGIGLAFCRRIVEGHGGRLSVTSAPEAGSTFTFTLPKNPTDVHAPADEFTGPETAA